MADATTCVKSNIPILVKDALIDCDPNPIVKP